MCKAECWGNQHRYGPCNVSNPPMYLDGAVADFPRQHYVKLFESGNTVDCGSPTCGLSKAHMHSSENCGCPRVYEEVQRIQNLIRYYCDDCQRQGWGAIERDSGRIY
ncbi:uncharacterized protein LAESUDRAFT_715866 [Laetiporus sulphureus 93-53]|uniref:Uncharacterized protein n=1 Tax=Laetiporus sulphureus 93-53 TaxID=1314785 RepID=A0A165D1A5_9APHY|nr:uncharacterized protein LAESUDRAFT_715866 [Laetiporus sulphureus 93-53]KZT03941.1 hypothetical protein LAESUDRAFT_715866 [Laetiporus sulphureus 93-53]